MKKLLLISFVLLLAASSFAQVSKPIKTEKENVDIKELQSTRDTVKAELKRKNIEYNKDNNKLIKLENDKKKYKDQLKSAKKAKKDEKIQSIQEKENENNQAIKDLTVKIKEEEKEIDKLEKDLKNAEKALKEGKEQQLKDKEKAKSKK